MTVTTSSSLLVRLRDRADNDAWHRLVCLYSPLLYEWLDRCGLQATEADDLVQEVLMTVAQEMSDFRYDRAKGTFRGWLRTILVHRLRHFRRSRKARPEADGEFYERLLDHLEDERSDLSRVWDREHDQHVVSRLLEMVRGEFEPKTWQAFRLVMLEEKDVAAVAEELHLSRNAVYLAKSRVLQRLRQEAEGLID